jgi:hypothetical protein
MKNLLLLSCPVAVGGRVEEEGGAGGGGGQGGHRHPTRQVQLNGLPDQD